MSWITLDVDAVLKQFNGDERALIAGVQVNDGMPEIITTVTKEVRGYVAKRNPVSSVGTTIPDELQGHTIAIIRYRFLNSLPGMKDMIGEGRLQEYKDAQRVLELVSKGDGPAIEPPTDVSTQVPDTSAPKFSTTRRRRRFNDCNQDGI